MKFTYDENVDINRNEVVLHSDNSFGSSYNDTEPWHFQVSLTEWADVILNFNKITHKCVSVEGYLFAKSKRICTKNIIVNDFVEAALLFKSNEIPDYGIEISVDKQFMFFDKAKNTLALGDIESQSELIKFGEGQFVKISDGKIIAVFIVFVSENESQ